MSLTSLFRRRNLASKVTEQLTENIDKLEAMKKDLQAIVNDLKSDALGEFKGVRIEPSRSGDLGYYERGH